MKFGFLEFDTLNNQAYLTSHCGYKTEPQSFTEVQIAGENSRSHMNGKSVRTSEWDKLKCVSCNVSEGKFSLIRQSDKVRVETVFESFSDGNTIRVHNVVTNVSGDDIVLENVPAFVLKKLFGKTLKDSKSVFFTSFVQGHHTECQPRRNSLYELGMFEGNAESQRKAFFASVGSQTTKERLPQGILEDVESGKFLMFQIESASSWIYEIGDFDMGYYLALGNANFNYLNWSKKLKNGESYTGASVAISYGDSFNEVVRRMSDYRRTIKPFCTNDESLPTIFNEYMHLSWDSPSEENTAKIAPKIAKTGVKYYVIDCGWHNEEDGKIIYPYVGQWKDSKARFPHGVRRTTDFIRSLGMKAGLWIEPEIVGVKCKEMLEYYDDDCFITRFGKKIAVGDRYFLDYRNEKVRNYMTETIRRMVEDYGADYIKFDYNQDLGAGTDKEANSFGDGLERCAAAFINWVREIKSRFKNVIFEHCASGGMRLDYKFLSEYSIVSTSDQTDYKKYAYIAGNILSAVLPEQAAVWSYPVDTFIKNGKPFESTFEFVNENISEEQIVFNMINGFLGRMHLASYINLLDDTKFALIKEGLKVYDVIAEFKKTAYPFFPNGLCGFEDDFVSCGLIKDDKLYLAVWNVGANKEHKVDLGRAIRSVKVAYPACNRVEFSTSGSVLNVAFTENVQARFFEVDF